MLKSLGDKINFGRWQVSSSVFVIVLFALAAVLRLDFLWASNFAIESDEAVVGLMAKRWLRGEVLPIFYYGQHYMGSLESFFVAISISFFGPTNFALKIVPFTFSLLLIPLLFKLTREVSNPRAAVITLSLYAVCPALLMIWSGKARGGYTELMFIGMLATFFFIKWQKCRCWRLIFLTGLTLGFGWWVNFQMIYYILPIGFAFFSFSIRSIWRSLREVLLCSIILLGSFFLGSGLFWYYNFQEDFASFEMFKSPSQSETINRGEIVSKLFSQAMPVVLGSYRPWQSQEWFPGTFVAAYVILLILILSWVLMRWRQLARFLTFRADERTGQELLAMHCFCVPLIFALSSFGSLTSEPRYLLPIYTSMLPLFGVVLDRLFVKCKLLAGFILVMLLLLNLGSSYWAGRAIPGEPFVVDGERVSKDHDELIDWLLDRNYTTIKTNYWIGYRLAYESKQQIQFTQFDAPIQVRIPEYEKHVHEHLEFQVPFVLVPSQAVRAVRGLKVLGYKYKKKFVSGYVVLHQIRRPIIKSEELRYRVDFSAEASSASEQVANVFDNDLETRWGSGKPQAPGMYF
jgi:4-amino-4-deoxy-L-arabinose transferase-like glycosyltransferase